MTSAPTTKRIHELIKLHSTSGKLTNRKILTSGIIYPSKTTKPAVRYIHNSARIIGWADTEEFVMNAYQTIKRRKLTIKKNNRIEVVWFFDTVKAIYGDKIGYNVHSWGDQLNVQISKEDGNIVYRMIMENAKLNGAEVIVENLWGYENK